MSKDKKTIIRSYFAWEYEREAQHLDRMSEKGWQLRRGSSFGSRFYRDDKARYRHQIDFRRQNDIDNMSRYIETFADQGWEYVNSLRNGWHYFRKPYDPALPEEEYRIYTDESSVADMKRRWTKGVGFLLVLILLITALRAFELILRPNIPDAVYTAMFLLEALIIGGGYLRMRRNKASRTKGLRSAPLPVIIVLIGGFLCSFALEDARPDLHSEASAEYYSPIPAELDNVIRMDVLNLRYKDSYYFSLEGSVEKPMTVSIVREDSGEIIWESRLEPDAGLGEVVREAYDGAGDDWRDVKLNKILDANGMLHQIVKNERLVLSPGEYGLYLSDFEGGAEYLCFDLD